MSTPHPTHPPLQILPYSVDPLAVLAQQLLERHRDTLPRLDPITVLLPDSEDAPQLREHLLQQAERLGHQALLGPRILDWRSWLAGFEVERRELVSDYRRELILLQALRQHSELFGDANLWALTDSLLTLFDELTLNRVGLPRTLSEFTRRVADGYGFSGKGPVAMDREAELVHTLWNAWHDELHQRDVVDRNTRYLLQLAASLEENDSGETLYLLEPDIQSGAEREWLAKMLHGQRLTLLLQGSHDTAPQQRYHPDYPLARLLESLQLEAVPLPAHDSAFSRLLDTLYAHSGEQAPALHQRAAAFAAQQPQSPLAGRLAIHAAGSDEEEARAVELQVRRRLLAGDRQIGIITENRRLARRVRALLERAGIALEDAAGWALSTTSAAAAVERWLQCVEEDFPHRAMLDLLKSPFFCREEEREAHLNTVYRLEQDIVLHENIGSGLQRYRDHLHYRQRRLPPELGEKLAPVERLLQTLQQAAAPLVPLLSTGPQAAHSLLAGVMQSLEAVGLSAQLEQDAAGMRLIEEMQKMAQSLVGESLSMEWLELRSWLGRSLERYNFQPAASGSSVRLMGLSQGALSHFDSLIIAGVEREHLPGTPAGTPFFNDAVRLELGLPPGEEQLAERFHHFRRLLEAAPRLLLTYRQQNDGEEIAPSPWLELLQAFHQLGYAAPLVDIELEQLLESQGATLSLRTLPLPGRSQMPAPQLPSALVPQRYSASAYQQLIDCPYQFFAARGLELAAPEVIREALEKSDYGERVHRCLQALHGEVKGLPGPYTGGWEVKRRGEAIQLLERISEAVFARDLEDNFLHRGWLQRWREQIPAYIDWQIARAEQWRVVAVEQQREQSRRIAGLTLHGRLDRCDSDGTQLAIVDYKTGQSADSEDILAGEAVQLPFYALLEESEDMPVGRVEYLSLDGAKLGSKGELEAETLAELATANAVRLEAIQQQLLDGTAMPAWGDERSCSYCKMAGLCRRQAWQDNKKGD